MAPIRNNLPTYGKLVLVLESSDSIQVELGLNSGGVTDIVLREVVKGPVSRSVSILFSGRASVEGTLTTGRGGTSGLTRVLFTSPGKKPRTLFRLASVPPGRKQQHKFSKTLFTGSVPSAGEAAGEGGVGREPRSGRYGDDAVYLEWRPPVYGGPRGTQELAEDGGKRNKDILYQVWYGTNRQPGQSQSIGEPFTSGRDEIVRYGWCDVFIPKSHRIGSLGSNWVFRHLWRGDDRLKLRSVNALSERTFWNQLAKACTAVPKDIRQAVVFIHGYNVSFRDAALRAAQIGCDLSIQGAMGFFSWPANGGPADYVADIDAVMQSRNEIASFLARFATQSGSDRVHVIAHSMGNRGLVYAIERIVGTAAELSGKKFTHLVLAAPDVNAQVFAELAVNFHKVSKHATLYVSTRDKALWASGHLNDYPRAGRMPPVTVCPKVDTISVGKIDLSLLGHGYVATSRIVLTDMYSLLHNDEPPARRIGLEPMVVPETGKPYWALKA